MARHLLGVISGQDGNCAQEAIESVVNRRFLLLPVLLATWGITGVGVWSLLTHVVNRPATVPKIVLKLLLTGTASLILTWVLVLAAVLSLTKGLRYRWPGAPAVDLLLEPELYGSLLLAGVLGGGSLLLAWVRGFACRDALGWLVLLLVASVLVSALAKRMIPRWRR